MKNLIRYTHTAEHRGIEMTPIGGWDDIAIYYSGTDGNGWKYQSGSWTNMGPIDEFRGRVVRGFMRGELYGN